MSNYHRLGLPCVAGAGAVLLSFALFSTPAPLEAQDLKCGGRCPKRADREVCGLKESIRSLVDNAETRGPDSAPRPAPPPGAERLSKLFDRGISLHPVLGETNPNAEIFRAWRRQVERLNRKHLVLPIWTPLGPERVAPGTEPDNNINALGRINTLAFDPEKPDVLYAGAGAGGFWRSSNNGKTWKTDTQDPRTLAVSGIAVDPRDSSHIYLLTGDGNGWTLWHPALPSIGVLESHDGGKSWDFTGRAWLNAEDLIFGFALVLAPGSSDVLFAATDRGLYRGEKKGKRWSWVVVQEGSFRDVVFKPGSCCVGYAATVTAIYRTVDGGDTWQPVFQPDWSKNDLPPNCRIALATTPKAPTTVYAVAGSDLGLVGVYRSDDCGDSFELRANAPNILGYDDKGTGDSGVAFYALSIAVSPRDPEEIYVGGVSIWKSMDGGRTFSLSAFWERYHERVDGRLVPLYPYVHADVHTLAFHPDRPHELFATSDGGVYVSHDHGEHWHDTSFGLRVTQVFNLCGTHQDPDLIYYGAQDNGSNRLGADKIAYPASNGDGGVCLIDYQNSDVRYLSQQKGVFLKSTDGGESFLSITPPVGSSSTPAYITPLIMHPKKPEVLFTCYQDLLVSRDRGVRWENLTNGALGDEDCVQVAVAPSDPQVIYVAKETALYWSYNGGRDWETRTPPLPVPPVEITDLAVSYRDAHRAWISFDGYEADVKVFETADNGFSWRNISDTLPNLPIRTIYHDPISPGRLYVGTDIGVYRRYHDPQDDTLEWLPFMSPPLIVNDLVVYRNPETGDARLRAGTYAQGVWEIELDPWAPKEE